LEVRTIEDDTDYYNSKIAQIPMTSKTHEKTKTTKIKRKNMPR